MKNIDSTSTNNIQIMIEMLILLIDSYDKGVTNRIIVVIRIDESDYLLISDTNT